MSRKTAHLASRSRVPEQYLTLPVPGHQSETVRRETDTGHQFLVAEVDTPQSSDRTLWQFLAWKICNNGVDILETPRLEDQWHMGDARLKGNRTKTHHSQTDTQLRVHLPP